LLGKTSGTERTRSACKTKRGLDRVGRIVIPTLQTHD
jgi:hypothetical protein